MSHFYSRDGVLVKPGTGLPSPTTALAVHRNPGLEAWRGRIGPAAAEAKSQTARDQGHFVHSTIEHLIGGLNPKIIDLPEPAQSMVNGYLRWEEAVKPTDMSSEMFVFSEEDEYAGTLDLLCKIDGVWWIVDFKTSKAFYPSMGLQLVSYAKALKEMTGIQARTGILQLTGQIKRGYRFKEYNATPEAYEEAYQAYKAHLTILKWELKHDPPDYPWAGGVIYT